MDFQKEFPLNDEILYLNHAAVAPWPLRTKLAVHKFATQNAAVGSKHYLGWLETEQNLRNKLATLVDANHSDEIALLKSTSEGLSTIAYGLDWHSGDEIIISNEEFPSNRIVWESLANQGVKVIEVDLQGDHTVNIENAITERTRLLAISSVQYASGRVIDLKRLGEICAQKKVLFCIDAIQSLGVMPFSAQTYNADFVVADGHKWMLGPEGLAVFYCKKAMQDQLRLNQFGWHMVADAGNFDNKDWTTANNAKRFECGSPNMLGAHALDASLSLILDLGVDHIFELTQKLHNYLREQLVAAGFEILSPPDEFCGITTFKTNAKDHKELYQQLMAENVICAPRGGGIRFSPNFYQDKQVIDKAITTIKSLLK